MGYCCFRPVASEPVLATVVSHTAMLLAEAKIVELLEIVPLFYLLAMNITIQDCLQ